MLQRVRDAIHDIDTRDIAREEEKPPMRKVNLIHRLDRGASGALLLTYADEDDGDDSSSSSSSSSEKIKGNTAQLIEAMQSPDSIKTYVALVRGEGILHGEDLTAKGWFEVSRPIKDESGEVKDATTLFNFVAGQPESSPDRPRVSLVLARPQDGRWHQIRKHLNGLSHPILGDSIHGVSKINREWREKRGMPGERIALHLGRLQLVPQNAETNGIDVSAPIYSDMMELLRLYAPDVLERALPILKEEGILVEQPEGESYEVGQYTIPEVLLQPKVFDDGDVDILKESEHCVVVAKPPVVVCHHSSWTGRRSDPKHRIWEKTPMLQRVRDKTGRRVNLVHRLDRGASGCLILSFAQENIANEDSEQGCNITRTLIESMQNSEATKTYIALCDGDGTWNGINYFEKGWFTIDSPIRDEWGNSKTDVRTDIRFVASTILPPTDADVIDHPMEGRKVSIVLARPHTGKWHQIRQHLASGMIGHAILGDSSHGGRTRTNRIWKKKRHLMKERVCLHLARVQLPQTEYSQGGIDIACPLPPDLLKMLNVKGMRELLDEARPILTQEGINL
jgi:23S rRNA-/tRNA-specific pseudouridylate synthase